jgi:hypothetical protein
VKALPIADLAKKISGSTDKKSKAYKAARRNLERYRKGTQKPKPAARKKIEKAVKAIVKKQPDLLGKIVPSGTISVSGVIKYSRDERYREPFDIVMNAEQMAAFIGAPDQDSKMDIAFAAYTGLSSNPGMYLLSGTVGIEFDA